MYQVSSDQLALVRLNREMRANMVRAFRFVCFLLFLLFFVDFHSVKSVQYS